MRQIKFRGLSDSGWKTFDLTGSTAWARELLEIMAQEERAFKFKTPLEQFTGLVDKNGKEIYEGDIVRDREGRTLEVFWNDIGNGFWFLIKDVEGEKYHVDSISTGERGNLLEVIGNIHESPELLKEPK